MFLKQISNFNCFFQHFDRICLWKRQFLSFNYLLWWKALTTFEDLTTQLSFWIKKLENKKFEIAQLERQKSSSWKTKKLQKKNFWNEMRQKIIFFHKLNFYYFFNIKMFFFFAFVRQSLSRRLKTNKINKNLQLCQVKFWFFRTLRAICFVYRKIAQKLSNFNQQISHCSLNAWQKAREWENMK